MIVADYIAQFLQSKGVKHIFGYQGSAILKIIDSAVKNYGFEYIQNFHEQASGFSAEAYARIRGDIGVAIATSGPGSTNLVTSIANAYMDSVPVFFITGQDYLENVLSRRNARQNGFQDLDITSIVKPICKYAVLINNEKRIKYELEKAYYLATEGRKGPVVLDIPIDIQFKDVDILKMPSFTIPYKKEKKIDLKPFLFMLQKAKRPVILAGGGIRAANVINDFKKFIRKTKIPVITTLNGIDVCDNSYGFAGFFGVSHANLAILNADLIIVSGSRLGKKHIGKNFEQYTLGKIIHIDIDKNEIGRVVDGDLNFNIDLKEFFKILNHQKFVYPNFLEWRKKLQKWFRKYQNTTLLNFQKTDPIKLVRYITRFFKNDTIITADVGQNQMWVAQGVKIKGAQRFLSSSGLGSMGYSLPAAIGASYLSKSFVVAFTGDGGLQMNLQELNTMSLGRNNVKCVVFNNNTLGMMRETQKRYYDKHYIGSNKKVFVCPDLRLLAKTFNLKYILINNEKDFKKLPRVFQNNKPYLIDVRVEYDSKLLNRYDDKALQNG